MEETEGVPLVHNNENGPMIRFCLYIWQHCNLTRQSVFLDQCFDFLGIKRKRKKKLYGLANWLVAKIGYIH